jgi:hypothetical protein
MRSKLVIPIVLLALTAMFGVGTRAQSSGGDAVPVTVDNFIRAESDLYLGNFVKDGALGKSCIVASPLRSTIRPSSGSTATRSIRRRCSISTPGR